MTTDVEYGCLKTDDIRQNCAYIGEQLNILNRNPIPFWKAMGEPIKNRNCHEEGDKIVCIDSTNEMGIRRYDRDQCGLSVFLDNNDNCRLKAELYKNEKYSMLHAKNMHQCNTTRRDHTNDGQEWTTGESLTWGQCIRPRGPTPIRDAVTDLIEDWF
ncbi:MAG: hypothetical protein CMH53_00095 [Myxococcales bacterium]|nr:hypothetical protein [Myxococcales bacterium]